MFFDLIIHFYKMKFYLHNIINYNLFLYFYNDYENELGTLCSHLYKFPLQVNKSTYKGLTDRISGSLYLYNIHLIVYILCYYKICRLRSYIQVFFWYISIKKVTLIGTKQKLVLMQWHNINENTVCVHIYISIVSKQNNLLFVIYLPI